MRLPAAQRHDLVPKHEYSIVPIHALSLFTHPVVLEILTMTIPYLIHTDTRWHSRTHSHSLASGHRTLLSLTRTCRALHSASVPYLVKHFRSDGTPTQLGAFLRFLLADLERRIPPLACLDWSTPFPGLRPRAWRFSVADEQPAFALLPDVFKCATWLKEVALPAGVFVQQPRAAQALAHSCRHVRELMLNAESAEDTEALVTLLSAACWPLEKLRLKMETVLQPTPLESLRQYAQTLTQLDLHGWLFDATQYPPEFINVHTLRLINCRGYHRTLVAEAFPGVTHFEIGGLGTVLEELSATTCRVGSSTERGTSMPMLHYLNGPLHLLSSLALPAPCVQSLALDVDLDYPLFLRDLAYLMCASSPSTLRLTLHSFRFLTLSEFAPAWSLLSSVRTLTLTIAEDSFCFESEGAMLMAALFTEQLSQSLAVLNVTHVHLDAGALWRRYPLAPLRDCPTLVRGLARSIVRASRTIETVSVTRVAGCDSKVWRGVRGLIGGPELEDIGMEESRALVENLELA